MYGNLFWRIKVLNPRRFFSLNHIIILDNPRILADNLWSLQGGSLKWWYPHSWMVYVMENPTQIDDDWGYPYFRKPPIETYINHPKFPFHGALTVMGGTRRLSHPNHPSKIIVKAFGDAAGGATLVSLEVKAMGLKVYISLKKKAKTLQSGVYLCIYMGLYIYII